MEINGVIKSELVDSVVSDDSGTDNLYIDMKDKITPGVSSRRRSRETTQAKTEADDTEFKPADVPEKTSTPLQLLPERRPHLSNLTTPMISDYPRPFLPPYFVPPPMGSFYPTHPMFLSGMTSSPTILPYHPPVFPVQPVQPYSSTPDTTLAVTCEGKSQMSPVNSGRTSPADSLSSSGVSSSSSPSPISSPEKSPPITKTSNQAPGGRTCYTPQQVRTMEKVFSENRYPDYEVFEKMSVDLRIPVKKIKVWFQNKRARNKSRFPEKAFYNMAAMMSSAPNHMMSFPPQVHPMMPSYQSYSYPVMFPPM